MKNLRYIPFLILTILVISQVSCQDKSTSNKEKTTDSKVSDKSQFPEGESDAEWKKKLTPENIKSW